MWKIVRMLAWIWILVGAAKLALAGPIIYDNGSPDQVNAFLSDFRTLSNQGGDFTSISADDFQLPVGKTAVADMHWWGIYADGNVAGLDDFTISIYDDLTSNPLHSIDVANTASRTNTGDILTTPSGRQFDLYAYWLDISPISLLAETTYWISIANNTMTGGDNWAWATSDSTQGNAFALDLDNSAAGWEEFPFELAFNLTTVPEPTAIALFGLGLAGLGWSRRKKA